MPNQNILRVVFTEDEHVTDITINAGSRTITAYDLPQFLFQAACSFGFDTVKLANAFIETGNDHLPREEN